VSHDLAGRRAGSDQEVVGPSFIGVLAGGHHSAANSVGGIKRTPEIRPSSALMRYGADHPDTRTGSVLDALRAPPSPLNVIIYLHWGIVVAGVEADHEQGPWMVRSQGMG
jgi:hypothetical protein